MAWTKSGTVNLTNGSAVVYGSGTAWVSGGMARPGDVMIAPNGALYEVASIQSNTQLTLSSAYLGSTASGQSYSLIHTGLLPSELAINLSSLQSKYLTTISQLWEWETSNAATVPLTNPATGVTTNVKPIAGLVLDVSGKAPIASPTFTGTLTHSGDVVLSGSGKRITGDFSNATVANRLMFQTSTINAASVVPVIPNGTSNSAGFMALPYSTIIANTAPYGIFACTTAEVKLAADQLSGGGGYLPMTFYTGGAERMRIGTDGSVVIAKPAPDWTVDGLQYEAAKVLVLTRTSNPVLVARRNTSDGDCVTFVKDNAQVGSVSVTTTSSSYNTSSDYRLKDNIVDLSDSGQFIDALRPRTWTWKADGSSGTGFIAHELQAVSPSSVTGEKDAVDAEGNPQYQAVEYGSAEVIAHLVNEIQSLRQRVAALEAV